MLDPVGASMKTYNITVSGEEGQPIVIKDVMYGNVLLCSGQVAQYNANNDQISSNFS